MNIITQAKQATSKRYREFSLLLFISMLVMTGMYYGAMHYQGRLSNWVYQTYTEPFLK